MNSSCQSIRTRFLAVPALLLLVFLPLAVFGSNKSPNSLVPKYTCQYGTSPTAAAMLLGYYDNIGFPDLYKGPTNNGVAPLINDTGWGKTDCPLAASRNTIDGQKTPQHVDDYWSGSGIGNTDDDPFVTAKRTEHTANCLGDFMGTSQKKFANGDALTSFVFNADNTPVSDAPDGTLSIKRDGCHGIRMYINTLTSYTVLNNYNQYIFGYNNVQAGFRFSDYKNELNAGKSRPVLLHLSDGKYLYTVLGVGYNDDNPNSPFAWVYDTTDANVHQMYWGQSYKSADGSFTATHIGVTVLQLQTYNVAPAISVPPLQKILRGGTIVFSQKNNLPIAVTDPDAGTALLKTTIFAYGGTVSINTANGTYHFNPGTGLNDHMMTFTSTLADLQQALTTVTYTASSHFQGLGRLVISVNDQGDAGGDAPVKTTTAMIPIRCWGSSGTVVAWGDNSAGQTSLPTDLTQQIVQVSAGIGHSLALRSNGTVEGWGLNDHNQYGGFTANLSGVMQIASGSFHCLALKEDGTLVSSGSDLFGQVTNTPTDNTFVAIAAAGNVSMALRNDGSIAVWGDNTNLQQTIPAEKDFVDISTGSTHCAALRFDGSLVAWGDNTHNEITNLPLGTGFIMVVSGDNFSLALKGDQSLKAWGDDTYGQVTGTPTTNDLDMIAAGPTWGLASNDDYTLVAWGDTNSPLVTTQVPTEKGYVSVACGSAHGLAVLCDITPPTITAPIVFIPDPAKDPLRLSATDSRFLVTATDDIDPNPTVVPDSFLTRIDSKQRLILPIGNNVIRWKATDHDGNTRYQLQMVVVTPANSVIKTWGSTSYNLNKPPAGNTFIAVAAGQVHSVALREDNSLVAWGYDGLPADGRVKATPTDANYAAVACGDAFNVAIKVDGSLKAWGNNTKGQCMVPSGTDYVAVAVGGRHALALHADGTIVAWGDNAKGQTTLPTGTNFYISIAAGDTHSVAAKADGTLIAWGDSTNSKLLCPTYTSYNRVFARADHSMASQLSTPSSIDWCSYPTIWGSTAYNQNLVNYTPCWAMATGWYHNLIITSTFQVLASGDNSQGQCTVPAGTEYIAVAAGQYHSLALHFDDIPPTIVFSPRVKVFVAPTKDPLHVALWTADLTVTDDTDATPTATATNVNYDSAGKVILPIGNTLVRWVAADHLGNSMHVIQLVIVKPPRGSLAVWGDSEFGQLDTSSLDPKNNYFAVAAGGTHSLALFSDGTVNTYGTIAGWGNNDAGQLDYMPTATDVVQVSAGWHHSIALHADGTVTTWGETLNHQQDNTPSGSNFVAVSAGYVHNLALKEDGSIVIWGNTTYGQKKNMPTGDDYVAISAGTVHNVALNYSYGTPSLRLWGDNAKGQLNGAPTSTLMAISAGGNFTDGLNTDGSLVSWGSNEGGATTGVPVSESLTSSPYVFTKIAAGGLHSIAIRDDGSLMGWGNNSFMQLTNIPEGNGFVSIAAGGIHSVGLYIDNTAPTIEFTPRVKIFQATDNKSVKVPLWTEEVTVKDDTDPDPQATLTVTNLTVDAQKNVTLPVGNTLVRWQATDWNGNVAHRLQLVTVVPPNGSITAWGNTAFGSNPVPTGTNFVMFAAGDRHATAIGMALAAGPSLTAGGSLTTWGDNSAYQVDDTPTDSGYVAVAACKNYTLALKADGTVKGWGSGGYSQGYLIPSLLKDVVAIAAGDTLGMALQGDGTVVTWGDDMLTMPETVTDIMAIAAAKNPAASTGFCLALTATGQVLAWGDATNGKTTVPAALSSGVSAIAVGYEHCLALKAGTITGWGLNASGQRTIPGTLAGVVKMMDAGGNHSIAQKSTDSTLAAWGSNVSGEGRIPKQYKNVALLAAGSDFNLALQVDLTAPVLTLPGTVYAEATGPTGANVTFTVTATDDIDPSPTVVCDPASGSLFPLGTTTVNVTATDNDGHQTTGSFLVTVRDTTAPTLFLSNITAEATSAKGATVKFILSASDAVSQKLLVTSAPAPGSLFPLGVTTVTVSCSDAAGNKATGTFTITVKDTTPPALAVPANKVVEATSPLGAIVTYAPTATDAVTTSPEIECSPVSGSQFPFGTTTVHVTATDAAGNVTQKSFTVKVQDTTAPVLTVPANIVAEATSAAGAVVTFTVSAVDAASSPVTLSVDHTSGNVYPLGTTTVTAKATDALGYTITKTFTITVQDTTPPTLTVPGNITGVEATSPAGAVVTYPAPTATDLVTASPTITSLPPSGSTFPVGTTTVVVTAKDAANNSATSSFTVTVVDTTAPVVNITSPTTGPYYTTQTSVPITVTATDAVTLSPTITYTLDGAPFTGTVINPSTLTLGQHTLIVTAKDAANNPGTAQVTFTIQAEPLASLTTTVADILWNQVTLGKKCQTFKWEGDFALTAPRTVTTLNHQVSLSAQVGAISNQVLLKTTGSNIIWQLTGVITVPTGTGMTVNSVTISWKTDQRTGHIAIAGLLGPTLANDLSGQLRITLGFPLTSGGQVQSNQILVCQLKTAREWKYTKPLK